MQILTTLTMLLPVVLGNAREAPVPASLLRQIATQYEIGRDDYDFGGVSEVRSFALSLPSGLAGEAYVTAALEALFPHVEGGRPADLKATCGIDPEIGRYEPLASPAACAAWHAATATPGSARTGRALATIAAQSAGDDDETAHAFLAAIDELEAYLGLPGESYVEVLSEAGDAGGDAHTMVLIDQARSLAHVVRYDW